MSNFLKYIPEDLAKELLELGMPLELYDVGSYCIYLTPTYGEVIDWFSSKGIHITFDVFFTFTLTDRIGYLWRISFIDDSNGYAKLKTISEEDALDGKEGYGGSFELDANDAIRYAMNLKQKEEIK